MVKLSTPVECYRLPFSIALTDSTMLLGSCFADTIGTKMAAAGFNVCLNPFGPLFNPASIASAVVRLDTAEPFKESDCIEMGAGAGKICSFHHHSSFARNTAGEFLENANASLQRAALFWTGCNRVIITLGTSFVWEHEKAGTVSNCLKRPACEFVRQMLSVEVCSSLLSQIVRKHPDKQFVFTVSPVRHLGQGTHENQLSKSTLHLSLPEIEPNCSYFPAYEIVMDELRDYRYYADDLCHPSNSALEVIWEKFLSSVANPSEIPLIDANLRDSRKLSHRPLLKY